MLIIYFTRNVSTLVTQSIKYLSNTNTFFIVYYLEDIDTNFNVITLFLKELLEEQTLLNIYTKIIFNIVKHNLYDYNNIPKLELETLFKIIDNVIIIDDQLFFSTSMTDADLDKFCNKFMFYVFILPYIKIQKLCDFYFCTDYTLSLYIYFIIKLINIIIKTILVNLNFFYENFFKKLETISSILVYNVSLVLSVNSFMNRLSSTNILIRSIHSKIKNTIVPYKLNRKNLFDYSPISSPISSKKDSPYSLYFVELKSNKRMFLNKKELSLFEKKVFLFLRKLLHIKTKDLKLIPKIFDNISVYKKTIIYQRMGRGKGKFFGTTMLLNKNKLLSVYTFTKKKINYVNNYCNLLNNILHNHFGNNKKFYFEVYNVPLSNISKLSLNSFINNKPIITTESSFIKKKSKK